MTGHARTEVPMFPLGTVLLPGGALPLHVFEPRYRALARRCVDNDEMFGVALIERGQEVGGGDVRTDVACLARIAEYEEFEDGRWALIAVGAARVVVDEWLEDDPYPRALVSSWADEDQLLEPDRRAQVVKRVTRVMAMAAEAGYQVPRLELEAATAGLHDAAFSHHLAGAIPIGPFDRHRLLSAPGPVDRLDLFDDVLDGVEAVVLAAIQDQGEDPGDGGVSDDPPSGML